MNDSAEVGGEAGESRVLGQLLPQQRVTGLGISLMFARRMNKEAEESKGRP